uniref:ATP synthase subunit a n=1 Tax=Primeuchroeus sp. M48 TaxID=161217 RepID=Q0H2E6_9HYME|nr:ATP synthase subunit 6 [Primeuchroeus sp. M48]
MMSNLFVLFDPSTSEYFPFNWLSMMLGLIILPSYMNYFYRSLIFGKLISKLIFNELKVLVNNKSSLLMFFSLFLFIMFNNFLGLFPYIFTSTSHLSVTLTLALPSWMSFMLFGWINKTNHMFTHLVPQNTPPILMPFMVLIETISNIIRAITLSVRLSANMIAGHLLMTLLSGLSNYLDYSLIILIMIQMLLITLESAVSIIQGYVSMILSTMYSSEVN